MNITKSFFKNIKKQAKKQAVDQNISYMKALELIAKEAGFSNFHELQTRFKKQNDHEANIVNANKGFDGVNIEFAQAQGNRGKQLNPNQQSSLLVVFNDDAYVNEFSSNGDSSQLIQKSFYEEYLAKGFAESIGGRLVSSKELRARDLDYLDDKLHNWEYVCIEFLRDKSTPWTIEEANYFAEYELASKLRTAFREFLVVFNNLCHFCTIDKKEVTYERYV